MRRYLRRPAVMPLLLLILSAPAFAAGTLVVQVRSDLQPDVDFHAVRVEVEAADECGEPADIARRRPVRRVTVTPAAGQSWQQGVRVAEIPRLWSGDARINVSALDDDGRVVVERTARARMNDGVQVVTVFLTREQNCADLQRQEQDRCRASLSQCLDSGGSTPVRARCRVAAQQCESRAAARCQARAPSDNARTGGLTLVLDTGDDDLRGGSDNLNAVVHFRDGHREVFSNVNRGLRWGDGCTNEVSVTFRQPVAIRDIAELRLSTTFGGGSGGDNWNLRQLTVLNKEHSRRLYQRDGHPLYRFTGSSQPFIVGW